jgi:hypothetical protein
VPGLSAREFVSLLIDAADSHNAPAHERLVDPGVLSPAALAKVSG